MATTDHRNPFAPPRSDEDDAVAPLGDAPVWLSERAWQELLAREPWARWAARLAIASLAAGVVRIGVVLLRSPSQVPRGAVVGTAAGLPFGIASAWFLDRCARRLREARETGGDAAPSVLDADRALLRAWGWMAIATFVLLVVFVVALARGWIGAGALT